MKNCFEIQTKKNYEIECFYWEMIYVVQSYWVI